MVGGSTNINNNNATCTVTSHSHGYHYADFVIITSCFQKLLKVDSLISNVIQRSHRERVNSLAGTIFL